MLVLDILKGSGELDSILSLSSSNQLDGMTHVSGSNDGRATTRGFGKIRTEFGADHTDSRVVYTSSKRDLASRLTQIQERDNLIGLGNGKGFHGGGSGQSDNVCMCLHHVELFMHHMTHC